MEALEKLQVELEDVVDGFMVAVARVWRGLEGEGKVGGESNGEEQGVSVGDGVETETETETETEKEESPTVSILPIDPDPQAGLQPEPERVDKEYIFVGRNKEEVERRLKEVERRDRGEL